MAKSKASLKLPVPVEEQEQIWLFDWAKLSYGNYPKLRKMYHITNEGKRSAIGGHRLVLQGLKKGFPDICLPVARNGFHGLYIEMKRSKGGVLSQDQKDWLQDLSDEGYAVETCAGWHKAAEALMLYLGGKL